MGFTFLPLSSGNSCTFVSNYGSCSILTYPNISTLLWVRFCLQDFTVSLSNIRRPVAYPLQVRRQRVSTQERSTRCTNHINAQHVIPTIVSTGAVELQRGLQLISELLTNIATERTVNGGGCADELQSYMTPFNDFISRAVLSMHAYWDGLLVVSSLPHNRALPTLPLPIHTHIVIMKG